MPPRPRSILVVSTEPWFGPLLSKQHVALQLARRQRVLFVDPAYNLADLARGRWPAARLPEHYHNLQPANLQRLQPWRLPKDRDSRLIGRLSHALIAGQIRARGFHPALMIPRSG